MRKLAVDEIISGLINCYEELLIVAADPEESPAKWHYLTGKVTALRWVLGQYKCSLDGTFNEEMIDTDELEHDLDETSAFVLATEGDE